MESTEDVRKLLIGIAVTVVLLAAITSGAVADRLFGFKPLDSFLPRNEVVNGTLEQKVVNEESAVIDVVDKVSPSVVTVSIETPARRVLEFSPFGGLRERVEGGTPQDIGSGFVVSEEGLVVTNKHVVSTTGAEYKVIDQDGNEYKVQEISKDPSNDIAVIKINPNEVPGKKLQAVELGDSENLKVGQFVIAIGTALGEFRHTVTTGVISGLGRGITAGSVFEGYVERLDNVIQTDAAINPGNSGGPLLNSAGQVIGVNVAVAQGAENIGFSIPIDVVKDGLAQFKSTGRLATKPYLGVQYQMISRRTALMNDVPEGALIFEVIPSSPAEKAGVREDDIITKLAGQDVKGEDGLANIISSKKPGDVANVEVWRDEQTLTFTAILSEFSE
jgi:S1-C subfamily serine protease